MTRRLAGGVASALVALLVLAGPVSAASYDIGQHLHVAVLNMPADGHPIPRAPYTFKVILQTHDESGTTGYLRVDDHGNTKARTTVNLGPGSETLALDWTIEFSSWSTGRHDLYWHLDLRSNQFGKRQFTTSRVQVCIVSCSPNVGGRPTPFLGAGGWYNDYMISVLDTPLTGVVPGATIRAHSQYGNATSQCAFLNPNFHNGSHGTALGCAGGGTGSHSFTIPASAVPGDNLVIVTRNSQQAGVLHLKVGDGSDAPTFYFETQDWWAQGGLVIP
jgi:hypothetical protein